MADERQITEKIQRAENNGVDESIVEQLHVFGNDNVGQRIYGGDKEWLIGG
jgi:hypothetical protein